MGSEKQKPGREAARWGDLSDDDDGEEQLHRPLPPRIGGDVTDLSLPLRAFVAPDDDGEPQLHRPLPPPIGGHLTDLSLPPRALAAPDGKADLVDHPLPPRVGDLAGRSLVPRVGDFTNRSLVPRVLVAPDRKGHLLDHPLPPPAFTSPDEDGVKTNRIDKYGNVVEVTTPTRRVRRQLPGRAAAILERRSWLKFGDAVEDGSASPVTEVSRDPIYLEQRSAEPVARAVGAYVPPRRFAAEMPPRRGAKVALTLNNLRLDADETDLKNLCICFGPLRSVSISRDSKTGRSKGVGVVCFFKTADAQAALATLQGYAYGHLILEVGWASA